MSSFITFYESNGNNSNFGVLGGLRERVPCPPFKTEKEEREEAPPTKKNARATSNSRKMIDDERRSSVNARMMLELA
jgi:hypothetical protein